MSSWLNEEEKSRWYYTSTYLDGRPSASRNGDAREFRREANELWDKASLRVTLAAKMHEAEKLAADLAEANARLDWARNDGKKAKEE